MTRNPGFTLAAAPLAALALIVSLATPARGVAEPLVAEPDPAIEGTPLDGLQQEPAAAPQPVPGQAELEVALTQYRQIAAKGGWPQLPDGPSLKKGMTDRAIPVLRRRLIATGDLNASAGESKSKTFDSTLESAVRTFQKRHGLTPDGAVGRMTREALNVSVEQRIAQLIVNLERLRNLPVMPEDRYVLVNIPAYSLELYSNGEKVLESPVVVGKDDWKTPTFDSEITEIIFNPSWYVPSSIARKELFPKDAANPGYLAREGIQVVHTAERTRLKQPPGPKNPLGRVKFHLPNRYGVYLHDTPSKQLMTRSDRAFSHGCVRVRDAVPLAFQLLSNDPAWGEAQQKRVMDGWKTRYVTLGKPVPIHVVYRTAWQEDGVLHFRSDVYEQDLPLSDTLTTAR